MILWFFYNVLKPYRLSSLSIALAWIVGAQFFLVPLWGGYMRVKKAATGKRNIQWWRAAVSACVLVGAALAVVFVPIPRRVWGVLTVQGVDQTPVFVPVPGRVESIRAQPGDRVEAGQVLVELANPELDDVIQQLEHRQRLLEISASKHASLDQPGEESTVRALRAEEAKQLQQRREQRERLVVRADRGGRIVPAGEKAAPARETQGFADLADWRVHPLREENLGARFEVGTHLCDIQPSDDFEAVMLVEQTEVAFLKTGQPVAIKVDGLPQQTLRGKITEIAKSEAEQPPHQLLVTKGGELPAKFNPDGSVDLSTTYYEVRASIDTADEDPAVREVLRAGYRGRARIQCGTWTCWNYLVRQWHKIFHM
jgi:putative peptide zinc metalloprotease protein